MKKLIKLFDPYVSKQEEIELIKTMRSHFWASGSGVGNVEKFENQFQKYIGSNACIAVNSGTAALNLALSLIDIKNKEVILPSLSFVSTAHAIIENGGIPKFVDIDPVTLCIDHAEIEKSITKKTTAIIPVHFGGMPCNLTKINELAKKNHLTIIEDAAHASGTTFKNKKIGSHSTAVCFSFHPVKNLAMPTGGLISINSLQYKKFLRILQARRWCGITNRTNTSYDVNELGWNYYMNEFSATIGLIQLRKLESMNKKRKTIAKKYHKEITITEKCNFKNDSSYHLYWIIVKDRKKFMKNMLDNGIETGIHYKPIHTLSMYKQKQRLPITENVGKHIVSIPIHPNLKESDTDRIIYLINKFT
jgi:dTDP-4-amino-4,6-dideoxygalactose transaminase